MKILPFKSLLLLLFTIGSANTLTGCGKSSMSAKTWDIAPEGTFSTAFSNHYVLIGSVSGNAKLWNLKKDTLLHTWQHGKDKSDGIIGVAISKNEKYAVTAQRDSLAWWRIRDGRSMGSWGFNFIQSVSLSSDGRFVLIGLGNQALYFSLDTGKTIYSFEHNDIVNATELSNKKRYALTGSRDKTVKLWNLSNGKNVYTWNHNAPISSIALSPNNRYVLSNESLGKTRLWSVKTGKLEKAIGPELMTLTSMAFSPNSKYIATGHNAQRIDLWETKTGHKTRSWLPKKTKNWMPAASTTFALQFTKTGKALLSASSNGTVQLWKMR